MAFGRHYQMLLWKNWVLKKRHWASTICELALPIIFVLIFVGLYNAFTTQNIATRAYSNTWPDPEDAVQRVRPASILPYRLLYVNQRLAVAPRTAAEQPLVDSFLAHISATYPAFNGSDVGGVSFSNDALRNVYIPRMRDAIVTFPDQGALERYISDINYGQDGGYKIWGAVVFNTGAPKWDYSIRLNGSEIPDTAQAPVNILQRGADLTSIREYAMSNPVVPGPPFLRNNLDPISQQKFPGFLTIQLLVDRWIINRSVPATDLDSDLLVKTFGVLLPNMLPPALSGAFAAELAAATGPRLAAIKSGVAAFLAGEAYTPQQVDFVPFPIMGYTTNAFYSIAATLFGLFFVLAFLYPVSRLIRGIVMEKEAKIQEGMRMMGLSDAALVMSWMTTYIILYAVLAGIIALMTRSNLFKSSQGFLVFLTFWLFGISSEAYAYLISVFFSRTRTASTLGIILFLAGYFPYFAVSDPTYALSTKTAACLLSPTAFGLALDQLAAFEDQGLGITFANSMNITRNFQFGNALGMMFADTLIYLLLAWYIDNVLPARFREFGVPRVWYFFATADYWREVFGMRTADPRQLTPAARLLPSADSRAVPAAQRNQNRKHNGPPSDPSFIETPDSSLQAKEREGRCVSVRGLRKEFSTPDGTKVAVDDIDLTMYEGQIFVLLGHNGAGKTTTISMLTGLLQPTDGNMSIYGRDVSTDLGVIRESLGVCPQHDVLWPELTVVEHLQLFAAIKGVPRAQVQAEVEKAIREVGLTEKRSTQARALSGGQRRKLSICIALIGGSKVVFLDEPTSGMDPYSRRSTWQILQNARADRTLLLSTHFMDEADILGDRIAIMGEGQVRCCGSPMFLKRRYGVGYVLTIVKKPNCDVNRVLEMLSRHTPDVVVATNVGAELSLRLPLGASNVFQSMFGELDAHADALGVGTYGISVTTMEDVFIKAATHSTEAAAGHQQPASPDLRSESGAASRKPEAVFNPVRISPTAAPPAKKLAVEDSEGGAASLDAVRAQARKVEGAWPTFRKHFRALFLKRLHFARRDCRTLVYQLLLPVIMVLGGLILLRATSARNAPDYQFTTANVGSGTPNSLAQLAYVTGPHHRVQFNTAPRGNQAVPVLDNYVPYFDFKSDAAAVAVPDFRALIGAIPTANISTQDRLTFNPAQADAITNPFGFETATSFPQRDVQRMSSFLLADRTSYAASKYGAYMMTRNNTLVPTQPMGSTVPTSTGLTYTVFHNSTALHSGPIFMNLINSAIYNRFTGSGSITARNHPLPLTLIQATAFNSLLTSAAAMIIIIAFSFIPASYASFIVKEREVSAKHQQLISGVSIPAYWLSNFAFDVVTYLVPGLLAIMLCFAFGISDFTSTSQNRAGALVALFLLYGPAVAPFTYVLSFLFKSHSSAQNVVLFINIAAVVLLFASIFMSQLSSVCVADQVLRFFYRFLPTYDLGSGLITLSLLTQLPQIDLTCELARGRAPSGRLSPYQATDLKATGWNLLYMGLGSIVYLALAIGIDVVLARPQWRAKFFRDPPGNDRPAEEDIDVVAERDRVATELRLAGPRTNGTGALDVKEVILLDNLRKVYPGGKVAVRGLSFGVPVGEVFGFLGINGAGKSTTMNMLAGDVLPSSGTAKLAGYDILSQQPQVRRLLGYAPQYDPLLEPLTVREHLELYARIKGVQEADLAKVVEERLRDMDLVTFAHRKAGTLSGGNKRKLSVACALMGDPVIIFLDEPSTGMDPVARRFMWSVVSRIATERKTCSIILTTHSMEECEALCQRVGIMVGGRMRCLGSIQHLKHRFGNGFQCDVKLDVPRPEVVLGIENSMMRALNVSPANTPRATIARKQVAVVAAALGNTARANQVTDVGTGWAVAAAFVRSQLPSPQAPDQDRLIPLREFAQWWAEEDAAEALTSYIMTAFPGATLGERQGSLLRFRLPPLSEALGIMFGKIEAVKEQMRVLSYSISQTSLENVFVSFASQQEEETGMARGLTVQPGAPIVPSPRNGVAR